MDSVEEKHISPPPAHVTVLQASGLRRVDGGYGNEFGFDRVIPLTGIETKVLGCYDLWFSRHACKSTKQVVMQLRYLQLS